MALFKKNRKKSPEQKYCENLMEQIGFAERKYAMFLRRMKRFHDLSGKGYEVRASHNTGVNYYKVWGLGNF